MRASIVLTILLLGAGCRSSCKLSLPCCDPRTPTSHCEADAPAPRCEPEAPARPAAKALPPQVEFKPAEEIRVKAPPAKVLVETAAAPSAVAAPGAAPQMPPPAAPQFAPPSLPQYAPAAPQFAPQYAPAAPQFALPSMPQFAPQYAPAAPQTNVMASTVQSVSPPRANLALGIEWVKIPVPLPRLFAIPGQQEVRTQAQFTAVPQPPAYAPAAMTPIVFHTPSCAPQPAATPAATPMPAACPNPAATPMPAACPNPAATPQAQQATQERLAELAKQVQMLEELLSKLRPAEKKD